MTAFPALLLVLLLAVNPARAALLASRERTLPRQPALAAALTAFALLAAVALAASPALDALAITPETFRVAAGSVIAVTGLAFAAYPGRPRETGARWQDGLFPLGWPVLANPAAVLAAASFAADAGELRAIAAIVPALAAAVVLAVSTRARWRPVLDGAARLSGALLTVAGVALVIKGVKAV
jgi:small neutral amino acid transporter SnatA (MarC family)